MIKMKRIPKETDQYQVDKAKQIIEVMIKNNPSIEGTIWLSAFMGMVARAFLNGGHSYETYKKENQGFLEHYKTWWDND